MKTALTIAGTDPTGGAGVQADLKVFHHFGVYGLSVVSALTVQNTEKVSATSRIEGALIEAQLNTLINDIRPDALKTGMLLSSDAVRAVAKAVRAYDLHNLVIDPVVRSSSGAQLLEDEALALLKSELFPLAEVITPNIDEAAALTGIAISDAGDMEEAAQELKQLGPEVIIITGGHFKEETLELVYDGRTFHRIRGKKIKGEYHGTGCAFSAAVAALLARGTLVADAARGAKDFVEKAITHAYDIGKGMRLLHV
ncbi:MAG: bifunctional hydroxymethylpyrimidine kinase/phosphomethylpyrimidine kinase [Nitrospirota bacterium]